MAHSKGHVSQSQGLAVGPGARGRRLRIADLADHLGLTKGTVSRALNGYPDIAESTRLRVRNAAEALGYRPLSQAQAIRTGKARSIGLILQVAQEDGHRPFLARFLAGVSEAASERGWTLTLATAQTDDHAVSLLEAIAQDRKADGFILPRTKLNDPRIAALRAANIPFVLYGRTADDRGCAWFDIAGEDAMADAVARLAALGHRRIGFVPGGSGYTYTALRQQGFVDGMAKAGLTIEPGFVAEPAMDRAQGAAVGRALIAQNVTAIVCSLDQAALGLYDAAAEAGLAVGRDLSIISYDGIPESDLVEPPLSTYRVDTKQAGARLTEHLLAVIAGAPADQHRELAQARFQDRGSHGPAPHIGQPDGLTSTTITKPTKGGRP